MKKIDTDKIAKTIQYYIDLYSLNVYNIGFKNVTIDPTNIFVLLDFITPEIGKRHQEQLDEISRKIGLPVKYLPNPRTNEIVPLILNTLPDTWKLRKNPSIHKDDNLIILYITNLPTVPRTDIEEYRNKIMELFGYDLWVKG